TNKTAPNTDQLGTFVSRLESVLEMIEDVPSDSKLETLVVYLDKQAANKLQLSTCIWVSHLATSEYIRAAAEERLSQSIHKLSGSSDIHEQSVTLKDFQSRGGILVSTGTGMKGLELSFVDQCIHYDLPIDPRVIEVRHTRFLRFGRSKPF